MVREVTPAIEAASSAVIILTFWLHSRHQDTTETLRLLNTTMRSVSMVISVRFVVLTRPPTLTHALATEASIFSALSAPSLAIQWRRHSNT